MVVIASGWFGAKNANSAKDTIEPALRCTDTVKLERENFSDESFDPLA
jgi:hypothetical protein